MDPSRFAGDDLTRRRFDEQISSAQHSVSFGALKIVACNLEIRRFRALLNNVAGQHRRTDVARVVHAPRTRRENLGFGGYFLRLASRAASFRGRAYQSTASVQAPRASPSSLAPQTRREMAPPTSIPSAKSPNGQELDLHTYQQLKDVAHSNLKSRAMNLRDVLKSKMLQGSLLQDHGATLKASSDQETLIKWCAADPRRGLICTVLFCWSPGCFQLIPDAAFSCARALAGS